MARIQNSGILRFGRTTNVVKVALVSGSDRTISLNSSDNRLPLNTGKDTFISVHEGSNDRGTPQVFSTTEPAAAPADSDLANPDANKYSVVGGANGDPYVITFNKASTTYYLVFHENVKNRSDSPPIVTHGAIFDAAENHVVNLQLGILRQTPIVEILSPSGNPPKATLSFAPDGDPDGDIVVRDLHETDYLDSGLTPYTEESPAGSTAYIRNGLQLTFDNMDDRSVAYTTPFMRSPGQVYKEFDWNKDIEFLAGELQIDMEISSPGRGSQDLNARYSRNALESLLREEQGGSSLIVKLYTGKPPRGDDLLRGDPVTEVDLSGYSAARLQVHDVVGGLIVHQTP